jgi:hypothetical protein
MDAPTTKQVSSLVVIDGALQQFIARLEATPRTPEITAKLSEARRLREIIGTWKGAPPSVEAETEIMVKAMDLIGSVPEQAKF